MYCRRSQLLVAGQRFVIASFVTATFLFLTGCLRTPRGAEVERLGVMPVANLTSNNQLDWASRALAAAVVYDLAGVKDIYSRQVDSLSAAQSMQATRLLEAYFFERNGRIGVHATMEDFTRAKTVDSIDVEADASAGFLGLANELARRLSPGARRFSTNNEAAFRFYGEALSANDSRNVLQALTQATGADSAFVAAYLDQAKVLVQAGDRDRARQILQAQQGAKLDPIDLANLQYVSATANGSVSDRMKALDSITVASPANEGAFKELGELRYARREFPQATAAYRAAARLDPEDPQIWNELGYSLAWGGDLKGAQEAMERYGKLASDDPNVLDSQGEVSYLRGDFKAAADSFERAGAKNPVELLKAAEAHLMMGDLQTADALFSKHLGRPSTAQANGAVYQTAQWNFLTGRRKTAMAQIEKLIPGLTGDLQALAMSQLAIWKLELGDRTGAADLANQAVTRVQNPQVRGVAEACRFIAAGGAASSGSKIVDAYTLLFAKKFQEGTPLLEALYSAATPANDGQVRTLLAWAYVETGAVDKAAGLVDSYVLPLSGGDALFASMTFPRYLYVRGAAMQKKGNRDESRRAYELFLKYAGDAPDQFGDEAKARAAAGL